LNIRTVKYLTEKNKERVETFAQKILSGKSDFKALLEIYDLLLAPIAFAYYFIGRFFLAKTFFASKDCDKCDICIKGCPVKAITKIDQRPYWTFNCESCMKCIGNCPKKAIEIAHGYILAYSLIFNLIFLEVFYKYTGIYFGQIENRLLKMVVESVLFLSFLSTWYLFIHWILRFKIVERFIVFTSFTKYKFWGRRYKALNPDLVIKNIK
jgi:ferredoxin